MAEILTQEMRSQWEDALSRFGDTVYRMALMRTGRRQDAEDVTQEVFLAYARRLRSGKAFESGEHEKAWLLRAAIDRSKNLALSAWFRHRAPLPEEIPFSAPEQSEVYLAVRALPEKYRTAIHLYYYEGYSVREIGQLAHLNENTVKSLLRRGREKLRDQLSGL